MFPVDPALYALFLVMMAVFAATPGPANVFAIATGVRSGPRAALPQAWSGSSPPRSAWARWCAQIHTSSV
jgi:hypothetical protein